MSSGSLQRVFLGWQSPLAWSACDWLVRQGGDDAALDLSRVCVLVPGRRSGRRLLQLVAERAAAANRPLLPPRMVTPGALPAALFHPPLPVASSARTRVALMEVLRGSSGADLEALFGGVPERLRFRDWLELAGQVEGWLEALAQEDLDPERALAVLESDAGPVDPRRWRLLHRVSAESAAALADRDLLPAYEAWSVRRRGTPREDLESLVLVGIAELGRRLRRLIFEAPLGRRCALVHAPEEEADALDEAGCPRSAVWRRRALDLETTHARTVERPRSQAALVAGTLQRWRDDDRLSPADVTVVTIDGRSASAVRAALEGVGIAAHSAFGRPAVEGEAAVVLRSLVALEAEGSVEALATLLRTTPFERWLGGRLADHLPSLLDRETTGDRRLRRALGAGDLPTALDRVREVTLLERLREPFPGDALTAGWLRLVGGALRELPLEETPRLPSEHGSALVRTLAALLGSDPERRRTADRSYEWLAALLEQAATLGSDLLGLRETVDLLLAVAPAELPPEEPAGGAAAVEVVGWLEAIGDDADAVFVLDLNAGSLPRRAPLDDLLPEATRRRLGLPDEGRRHGRDAFLLQGLAASRSRLELVVPRRSDEGDPLLPSPLLLTERGAALAVRVEELLGAPVAGRGGWLRAGGANRFGVPRPGSTGAPEELRVTDFAAYLACPYRYYLRRVLGLWSPDEEPGEITAPVYGALAHEVLSRFSRGPGSLSTDAGEIHGLLSTELGRLAERRFGAEPPVTVRVQLAQLGLRFERFARWQAEQTAQGWRTDPALTEREGRFPLEVDGEPCEIVGRIDRVDRHPDGRWRLVDYKTGDRPVDPEGGHRRRIEGERMWVDLQLPLYALLARRLGVEGEVELGYVRLSKKLGEPVYAAAGWDAASLDEALEAARDVVRRLRAGVHWPPAEPPRWPDELRWVAGDTLTSASGREW